ncbi:UV-damaged DNA-binding protein rad7, partial [Spiromyces aspiralis]
GKKITTETLISALDAVGSGLTELTLAECPTLDDTILTDGILACCPRLTKLRLEGCPRISAEACATFLSLWREKRSEFNTNLRKDAASAQSSLFESAADSSSSLLSGPPPTLPYWPDGLQLLSFKRCTAFSDDVLIQLVLHSGPTLTSLDLHSVSDNLTERGLLALAGIHLSVPISDDTLIEELLDQGQEVGEDDQHIIDAYRKKREAEEQRRAESVFLPGCPKLEYLNLSFVRAITDDILYKIIK